MKFSESTYNLISTLSFRVEIWRLNSGIFENLAANFFQGLTQNSIRKLKVDIQFYVDSENFMKKYQNPIEFYYF